MWARVVPPPAPPCLRGCERRKCIVLYSVTTMELPMVFFAVAVAVLLVPGASGIAQLCPCSVAPTWNVTALDAPSNVKPSADPSQCLAITPGPPTWGPEGSGALVEACSSDPHHGGGGWQDWTVSSRTVSPRILWPKNSSMCLTVLPPKPAPKALVGLWFCGAKGFQAAQAFGAVVAGAAPLYQLQLKNTTLCVSPKGTC